MLRSCALALVLLALAPGASIAAEPPVCDLVPLEEQYRDAGAAFVGRLESERAGEAGVRVYRFRVERVLKGPIGGEVELSAPLLTDRDGTPLARDVPVGVLVELQGARLTTDSCGLVDPGSLVSASEPQRGTPIKIAIGLVLAAVVLGLSVYRLRRRQRPPGARVDRAGEPPPSAPPGNGRSP